MSELQGPFYHGGIDGLRVGDLLEVGHPRRQHKDCPWCAARAEGKAHLGIDGPSERQEIYFTRNRLYAKYHAALYGLGDLYRVMPVDPDTATRSTEDTFESYSAIEVRVEAVLDRAVQLTWTERRRLAREWKAADDAAAASFSDGDDAA